MKKFLLLALIIVLTSLCVSRAETNDSKLQNPSTVIEKKFPDGTNFSISAEKNRVLFRLPHETIWKTATFKKTPLYNSKQKLIGYSLIITDPTANLMVKKTVAKRPTTRMGIFTKRISIHSKMIGEGIAAQFLAPIFLLEPLFQSGK